MEAGTPGQHATHSINPYTLIRHWVARPEQTSHTGAIKTLKMLTYLECGKMSLWMTWKRVLTDAYPNIMINARRRSHVGWRCVGREEITLRSWTVGARPFICIACWARLTRALTLGLWGYAGLLDSTQSIAVCVWGPRATCVKLMTMMMVSMLSTNTSKKIPLYKQIFNLSLCTHSTHIYFFFHSHQYHLKNPNSFFLFHS